MTSPSQTPAPPAKLSGTASPTTVGERWHTLAIGEVLERLQTSPTGLDTAEAARRLERFGPNALQAPARISVWEILIAQFRSVVVLLLIGAALVAWVLGDVVDSIAVAVVLLINASLGFATEYRARTAMAALLKLEVPRATVRRDGHVTEIPAQELVPGDIIILEAGQSVPADARLLSATDFRTSEAPLTGESLPVDKVADDVLREDTPLAERTNLVFMSTSAVAGRAEAVVFATGMETEVGRIGGLVGRIREEKTPLEHRLDALGRRLVWAVLGMMPLVVLLGVLRGEPLGRMLETAIALAVAAVPEGLPAVSTITLAVGVARMARRNALVRRLPAVEALGSATTVCTDKTGTLTAGEMTLTSVWTAGREYTVTGAGYEAQGQFFFGEHPVDLSAKSERALRMCLRVGVLANRASLSPPGNDVRVIGDPTEAALLVAGRKAGMERADLLREAPEIAEVPFSSERMWMATVHRESDGEVVYLKGAPARVVERCSRILTDSGEEELDEAAKERVLRQNRQMASRGLRVLALAYGRPADGGSRALYGTAPEGAAADLTFAGLVGISDPPAEGVPETVQRFQEAGIRVVMITGDQRLTAAAVASSLRILEPGDEVLEGRELARLSKEELRERIPHVSALSRVTPEEKLRIVEALQDRGEIVAMLGDGVNDAAALKKADIGVAMGIRGTDVAKEAAAVVLQDDRFATIGAAVEEGRVIFDNIRKFVFYLFSCNLAEVLVIIVAGLLGLPQPLLPLQILWLNLVTDTFPALSLAIEPGEPEVMQRPPEDPKRAILSAAFFGRVSLFSLLITAVTLGAFVWALNSPSADATHAGTIAFMTLALSQVFHLGNARDRRPVLAWHRVIANRWALGAVALTFALQFLAVYFEPLAEVLDVQPLTLIEWLVVLPLAFLPAIVGQTLAWIRWSSHPTHPAVGTSARSS